MRNGSKLVVGLCVVLLAMSPRAVRGLPPDKPLTHLGHDAWLPEHGLPRVAVSAIAQDQDGYLWLGTQGGAIRFDGVSFEYFSTEHGLSHDHIQFLFEDREGHLWIGNDGGLDVLRDGNITRFPSPPAFAQKRDRVIEELTRALAEVKTLRGFIPICAHCEKIRDDQGFWQQIETYLAHHSEAEFTHGLCPECAEQFFPGVEDEDGD